MFSKLLSKARFGTALKRDPKFAVIQPSDLEAFKQILPNSNQIISDESELESYNNDWTLKFKGQSKLMLKPNSTEEVSGILKHCNQRKLAVVPQAGNTGLVGGSNPLFDEIIINMSNMNKVLGFDKSYGIVSSQSGVILQELQEFAQDRGQEFPIDLGSKGSCQIGGNLATNAGGINFILHNSLHANCIGLKAVLPNGDILDNMTTLRKDNTGYDLKQLFIGAEGTLGIITECAILCSPMPKTKNLVVMSCKSFEDVLQILHKAKAELADILRAIEFLDWDSMKLTTEQLNIPYPFNQQHEFFCMVEVQSHLQIDEDEGEEDPTVERLFNFIESCDEFITDGLVPQDTKQARQIWDIREGIAPANLSMGYSLMYDVSLTTEHYYECVKAVKNFIQTTPVFTAEEKKQIVCAGYGHVADGNLHMGISLPGFDNKDLQKRFYENVDPFIMDFTRDAKGSVSAEHGVGITRKPYLGYSKSPEMINAMRSIKNAFDPHGIMNPYKLLRPADE